MTNPTQTAQRYLGRREPLRSSPTCSSACSTRASSSRATSRSTCSTSSSSRSSSGCSSRPRTRRRRWASTGGRTIRSSRRGNGNGTELEERLERLEQEAGIEERAPTSRDLARALEAGWYVYGVVAGGRARRDAGVDVGRVVRARALRDRRPCRPRRVRRGAAAGGTSRTGLARARGRLARRRVARAWWARRRSCRFGSGRSTATSDGVRAMLREREVELRGALERLRGHVELGVKVFLVDTATRRSGEAGDRPRLSLAEAARARRSVGRSGGSVRARARLARASRLARGRRAREPAAAVRAQRQA